METKFTKGEWIVSRPNDPIFKTVIATTEIQENPNKAPYVCDMWGMATEEGKANANLISAAPDMFNALRDLYDDRETWSDLFEPQQEFICLVLNKATGSDSFQR